MSKKNRFLYLLLAIGIILFDQIFQILGIIFLMPLIENISSDSNFYGIVISLIELIVFLFIYNYFFSKNNILTTLNKNQNKYILSNKEIILISIGFIGLVSLWFILVENYLIKIPSIKSSYDYLNESMDLSSNGESFLLGLIYASIVAAFVEEYLFRGIIHNSLKLFSNSRIFAIFATGILFGVWHRILVQGVYAAIGGILFSYIYERTGKLSTTISIHFINNFLSTIVTEIDKYFVGTEKIFSIICIFAVPILFYYMYKMRNKSVKLN